MNLAPALVLVLSSFSSHAVAQYKNEDCLACHARMEYGEPKGDMARIHDVEGRFLHEPHATLSCTDCHADVTEVPHRQGVERKIRCETCHN